ncbi:MAG: insulinase family protein [Deltaproteobacteria bacterium]|nr:insulinase family protein [Deltaproteobacteria bacterium]
MAQSASARTTLPPVERYTLDNGLEVLLLPQRTNPFFECRFVARAGSASDPAGKEGLAQLTARMLTNGTPTMSEEELARAIEDMGATLAASASLDTFAVQGTAVTLDPSHRDRLLALFADVLFNASFPEESLAKTRALTLAGIKRLVDEHDDLADAAFAAALYGDGPRGRMRSGTLASVPTLTRADLVGYRDRVLIPQHAVFAVAGDFDVDAMRTWISETLGRADWGKGICEPGDLPGRCARLVKGGEALVNPFANRVGLRPAPAARAEGRRVVLVDRDDPSLNQVQWRLGQDNPVTLLAPSWAAFRLGTQILGGDFTARLNMVLRVREGLTYGARFNVSYGAWDSGSMRVATYVAPKDVEKAIDLSLGELEAVTSAPLPDTEVESFKAKINNGFPFKFETISDTLEQYLYLAVDGVDVSWLETYTDRIAAPTPAEVNAALSVITPASMTLVAVGNRDLIPVLARYGKVEVVSATDFLESGLTHATAAE